MEPLITLAIIGVIVWLLLQLPMPAIFKTAIQLLAILYVVFWLLRQLPQ